MEQTPHSLEALLAELAQGQVESTGVFTLDPARAREMLAAFQFDQPHLYVVPLVAAAVSEGARTILVSLEDGLVALAHDGQTLRRDDLEGLFSSLLIEGPCERSGPARLALALNACLTLPDCRVTLRSWNQEQGYQLTLDSDTFELSGFSAPVQGQLTAVEVRHGGPSHKSAQRNVLENCFRHVAADLTLNGRLISQPIDPGPCLVWRHLASCHHSPDLDLRLALPQAPIQERQEHSARFSALIALTSGGESELHLLVEGRCLPLAWPWSLPFGGLKVFLASDRLKLDLSQTGLVADHVYRNLMGVIWDEVLRTLSRLPDQLQLLNPNQVCACTQTLLFLAETLAQAGALDRGLQICLALEQSFALTTGSEVDEARTYELGIRLAERLGRVTDLARLQNRSREARSRLRPDTFKQLEDGEWVSAEGYLDCHKLRILELTGAGPEELNAQLQAMIRRYEQKADPVMQERLYEWQLKLPSTSPRQTLEVWLKYSQALYRRNKLDKSREGYRQALALCATQQLPGLQNILDNLSSVEWERGDRSEALDLATRAVSLWVSRDGQRSPSLYPLLTRLAFWKEACGFGAEAQQLRAWAAQIPRR